MSTKRRDEKSPWSLVLQDENAPIIVASFLELTRHVAVFVVLSSLVWWQAKSSMKWMCEKTQSSIEKLTSVCICRSLSTCSFVVVVSCCSTILMGRIKLILVRWLKTKGKYTIDNDQSERKQIKTTDFLKVGDSWILYSSWRSDSFKLVRFWLSAISKHCKTLLWIRSVRMARNIERGSWVFSSTSWIDSNVDVLNKNNIVAWSTDV